MKNRQIFFFLLIVFTLVCCINKTKVNSTKTQKRKTLEISTITDNLLEKKENINIKEKPIDISSITKLDNLQGIWKGNKDLNQSIPFRIQFKKKVLDVVCIEGDCGKENPNNFSIEFSFMGFSKKNEKTILAMKNKISINDLYGDGSTMIKISNNVSIDKDYELDTLFYSTKLTSSYLFDETVYNHSSFLKINILPVEIFTIIKSQSKQDNINYIKEYNIYNFSKKVKIKVNKTFFHNEMSDSSKRKAFLVNGDIAYLEEISNEWAKVYYDGKIISSGYVKVKDIDIIDN